MTQDKTTQDQQTNDLFLQDELEVVRRIVWKHLDKEKYKAFVFGSAAEGRMRRASDLDIGVEGAKPAPYAALARIGDDLEESTLPFTVDLVDFKMMPDEFVREANKHRVYLE